MLHVGADLLEAILLVNVLNYYEPLRQQIISGIEAGFIKEENLNLVTFVNGPADLEAHATFDWGNAVINALNEYKPTEWKGFGFDWSAKLGNGYADPLSQT
jgi:hypothetical protein